MLKAKQDGSGWEDCGEANAPKSNVGKYHRYNRRFSASMERIVKKLKKLNYKRSEKYVRAIKRHQFNIPKRIKANKGLDK